MRTAYRKHDDRISGAVIMLRVLLAFWFGYLLLTVVVQDEFNHQAVTCEAQKK